MRLPNLEENKKYSFGKGYFLNQTYLKTAKKLWRI